MCPSGTLFDVHIQVCNWSSGVSCACSNVQPDQTSPTNPTDVPIQVCTVATTTVTIPMTSNLICGDCPANSYTMIASVGCTGFYCKCASGMPFIVKNSSCLKFICHVFHPPLNFVKTVMEVSSQPLRPAPKARFSILC